LSACTSTDAGPTTSNTSKPSSLVAASKIDIIAAAGSTLSSPPTVQLTDSDGRPLGRAKVVFDIYRDAGGAAEIDTVTDDGGLGSLGMTWPVPSIAGHYRINVLATAAPTSGVTFNLIVTSGVPAYITAQSGDQQQATVGDDLPDPIAARVTDKFGNPIAEVRVEFAIESGGGRLGQVAATTLDDGTASPGYWTMGRAGEQKLVASSGNLTVEFTAFACANVCVPSQIVFVRGGNIRLVREDGSRETVLTTSGSDTNPVWSPDGTLIAFVHGFGTELWTMSPTGAVKNRIAVGSNFGSPAWSPDGRQIAVRRGSEVVLLSASDSTAPAKRVYTGPASSVAWPPGGRIAVVDSGEILLVDKTTGERSVLPTPFAAYEAKWSPDGSKIAITRDDCDISIACHSYLAFGDTVRNFSVTLVAAAWDVTWSPDGSQVAFTLFRTGETSIARLPAFSTSQPAIVTRGNAPSWQPTTGRNP